METPTAYTENLAEAQGASSKRETRETRFLAYWRARPLGSIADVAAAFERFEKSVRYTISAHDGVHRPTLCQTTDLDEAINSFTIAARSGSYTTIYFDKETP